MDTFLETDRLTLCRFTASDVDNLFDLNSDPDVMRFINGGIPTPRDVIRDKILPSYLREYERLPGFGDWAAIERSSGNFVGRFSLRLQENGSPGDVALGYRLRRSAWGQGYATEGARALIHKGFSDLGMQRVFATTYQDNRVSRRVMEKVGMTLVRSYRLTTADLAAEDDHNIPSLDLWDGDDVEYALLKADWERQEAI